MPDDFAFEMPPPDWMRMLSVGSSSGYVPHVTVHGVQATAAPVSSHFLNTTVAEAQAAKIPELLQGEPPVELLQRLDPEYVGTIELVRIIGGRDLDYAIEFTTPRGKMRVAPHRDETWEECLIRVGLLDGP